MVSNFKNWIKSGYFLIKTYAMSLWTCNRQCHYQRFLYLRQMWLYNFGVHCLTCLGQKSYFFTWTENIANRGNGEIASCLFRFCELFKCGQPEINHLIIWSDSCGGQNKNFFFCKSLPISNFKYF